MSESESNEKIENSEGSERDEGRNIGSWTME